MIPAYLVSKLAREHGVDAKARMFSPWSHVVALLYSQLAHALSLNDVCDSLRLWRSRLLALRGATPPSRNNLSHANKTRDCRMAEALFWRVPGHLESTFAGFGCGKLPGRVARFRCAIHVVDSTVIKLVFSCLDWAKHRRRKAGIKCHMRIGLKSLLPECLVIGEGKAHDRTQLARLCAALKDGQIVLFDKGYYDFAFFMSLSLRGVFFVTRAKDNLACHVTKRLPRGNDKRILRDDLIVLKGHDSRRDYPQTLRRVTALVELEGKQHIMVF